MLVSAAKEPRKPAHLPCAPKLYTLMAARLPMPLACHGFILALDTGALGLQDTAAGDVAALSGLTPGCGFGAVARASRPSQTHGLGLRSAGPAAAHPLLRLAAPAQIGGSSLLLASVYPPLSATASVAHPTRVGAAPASFAKSSTLLARLFLALDRRLLWRHVPLGARAAIPRNG